MLFSNKIKTIKKMAKQTIASTLAAEAIESGVLLTVLNETTRLFNDEDKFKGIDRVFEKIIDDAEFQTPKNQEIVTTVKDRLDYTFDQIAKVANIKVTKEEANSSNTVDLVVNGINLGPKTMGSLLVIKALLEKTKLVVTTAKTLPPGVKWVTTDTPGKWRQDPVNVVSNVREITKWVEVSPATQHHKADVREQKFRENFGITTSTYYSSLLTSQQKYRLLRKLDDMLIEVAQAISEFNQVQVNNVDQSFSKIVEILKQEIS